MHSQPHHGAAGKLCVRLLTTAAASCSSPWLARLPAARPTAETQPLMPACCWLRTCWGCLRLLAGAVKAAGHSQNAELQSKRCQGARTCTDVVPVRVQGRQLLEGAGLHVVDVLRQLDLQAHSSNSSSRSEARGAASCAAAVSRGGGTWPRVVGRPLWRLRRRPTIMAHHVRRKGGSRRPASACMLHHAKQGGLSAPVRAAHALRTLLVCFR